jgi:hypothetical protein
MGLIDDCVKGNVATGLAIGIGAAILAPALIPALAGVAKPLIKAAVKSGIIIFEKGKESVAELSEIFEDVVAEAKAEMADAHAEAALPSVAPEGETGA